MQQSNDCHGTGGPTANAAETHGNVHQNQYTGSHNSHNALGQELVADGGVDVADFLLDKLVVRVGGVQGFDHAVQLLGGKGLAAGQVDGQGLCTGNISAGLYGQVALAQLGGYRLLDIVQVNIALVANGNHSATLELDIHGNAEDKAEYQHHATRTPEKV